MGWVLADSTSIDGVFYELGTYPPEDVAARVGQHLRREVDDAPGSKVSDVEESDPAPIVMAEPPGDGSATFGPEPTPEPEAVPEVVDGEGSLEVEAPTEDPPPDAPALDPAPLPVPNRGGKGSSREHWAAYAESQGVIVTDDMERNEIIDACRTADVD